MRKRSAAEQPTNICTPRSRFKEPLSLKRRRTPVQKIMQAAKAGKSVTLNEEDVAILSEMPALEACAERDADDDDLREEVTGRSYREG